MMTEATKTDRSLSQLGLPPMQLAESTNESSSRCLYRCMIPALQKVLILFILLIFSAGLYIILLKFLETTDHTHKAEIFLVTGIRETKNITLQQNEWDIFLQLKNDTNTKRRKRNVLNPRERKKEILDHIRSDDLNLVKEIILKHHTLCHDETQKDICDELIEKLKAIIGAYEATNTTDKVFKIIDLHKGMKYDNEHNAIPTEVSKRETHSLNKIRNVLGPASKAADQLGHDMPHYHPHVGASPPLTDTCLLAKLLKQSYPQVHEIYDPPAQEVVTSHFDQPHLPNMRYFHPSMPSYMQSREIETPRRKLHPQDVDIFMSFFNKPDDLPNKEETKSSRAIECPSSSLACNNNEDCIKEKQWCDGNVDCSDASDEIRCSCKSRVDKSRLCDGYFDCPFGEDEMGCFGCSENTFSCGIQDTSSQSTCFTKEQRCNSVVDCPNQKDEIECNMLAPSLNKKPMFAISNTEGYLHRNFKGDWYAVCQNPYMWAHDACRRETGLIIRPPIIQFVPIDPILKVDYLNTGPGGLIQTSDSCFNSSAVYVMCPDFLCGTRVQTTSQILRENLGIENHLFGRNKRFLYPGLPFDPYHMMFYGNRMKRDLAGTNINEGIDKSEEETGKEERSKRAQGRVVGGKPSQPAAWPWMVAIYRNGMFHCGGVILTQSWIISAAHCVHKFWDNYYEIQVGMLRRFSFSPQEQNHRVTHVIVNHHYNQVDMRDDLSLLKVEPAIQFSRWVRPICLPGPNTAGPDWMWGPAPGTICTAVGWGATEEHGQDPDHMREVEVPIWANCKHSEDRAGKEICAGLVEGGRDACQGDSGGPLLCRNPLNSQQWYLAGIVSHGDGCARKDEPGVYTRVSLFVKWIKYHTLSNSLPLLQPIQECPGFKCESGIPKCLPNIRKCDKIVDCLDAEDEVNCDFNRSSNNIQPSMKSNTKTSRRPDKNLREVESKFSVTAEKNTFEDESVTAASTYTDITSTTTEFSTDSTTESINNFKDISKTDIDYTESSMLLTTTVNENLDLTQTSTRATSSTINSDEQNTDDSENVTVDPLKVTVESKESVEITSSSDLQTFAITLKPDELESRSSILKESSAEENSQSKARKRNNGNDMVMEESELTSTLATQTNDDKVTTEKSRGDTSFDDETNTKNDLLDNTVIEPDNKAQSNNIKDKPRQLVIELLPKLNSSLTETSKENGENLVNDSKSNNKITESLAKNLPDFDDKTGVIQKIEDIVFSELQPASIRRKHRVPNEFDCRRIYQKIPYDRRCDHKADCEDGTDELDCACIDYLSTFDKKLICDGIFDCSDGQDEIDCFSCPENHFICKRSEICLPTKYVCDGTAQCPLGEDELNCFALSNGREMFYDVDEKPKVNLEGFLTKRNKDDWQVVCEDKLTIEQQEESAAHICRYLGFSSANRYFVKYINIKEEDIVRSDLDNIKKRRSVNEGVPVHFTFREVRTNNATARNIVIKEPQILKEECVPNITKTCKSLYVFCDRSLYANFEVSQDIIYNRAVETNKKSFTTDMWPWIAKIYVDGDYKCTGVLIDLSWALVTDSCLWDTSLSRNFITVILGSHRTLNSITGVYEQVHKVDAKKDLYRSRVILLHLKKPAEYSNMVKPMTASSMNSHSEQKIVCVAVGQDNNNNTISIFLNETNENCNLSNRCFVRNGKHSICSAGIETHRQWSGLISCHNEHGWYPAASFVDSRGECGIGERIVATDIENLKQELKYYSGKVLISDSIEHFDNNACDGVRCSRGKCVTMRHMCDGVRNCEDGKDEAEDSCKVKRYVCERDPYHNGCECTLGQMKCKNGNCVPKELFRNGADDCGDGTDEPMRTSCSDYLARVMPSRLCDGVLHCQDRSDEDPMFCKCFAKQTFKCDKSSEMNNCVAPDMVCDGVRDCPNGEDERTCIGLIAPEGTVYGTGQVIVRSHGVWHSKCYPTQNHTKSELEAICRELGFISGHAKQIKDGKFLVNSHNTLLLEPFSDVVLNKQTVIKMRNTNDPIARPVFDINLKNCFPVFIECL